jgi:hypothetical protein
MPVAPISVEVPVVGLSILSSEGPFEAVIVAPYNDEPTHSSPVNEPASEIGLPIPAPVLMSNF